MIDFFRDFTPNAIGSKQSNQISKVGVMCAALYCCEGDYYERTKVLFELLAQEEEDIYLQDQSIVLTFESMIQFASIHYDQYINKFRPRHYQLFRIFEELETQVKHRSAAIGHLLHGGEEDSSTQGGGLIECLFQGQNSIN